jgi:Ca-activated chloride channel family protein
MKLTSRSFYILLIILALATALIPAKPANADGIIIIDPPPEPPVDRSPWLTILYHHVTIKIEDQIAITTVDQAFRNDHPFPAEGTYLFPLPKDAVVQSFVMWVDGQPIEGEILDANEAQTIYENYVQQQRDPALLEYVGRDAVKARIFPISPNGERRIQLTYTQVLPLEENLLTYRYPLDTERFSAQPLEQVSIKVDIETQNEIRAVYSPSHQDDIIISYPTPHQATVSYEQNHLLPDRDFELYIGQSDMPIGAHLLTYQPTDENGFFLLFLSPSLGSNTSHILPKDVFLVLDTSGSMEGEKLEQAKKALHYVLRHLNTEDRFNIIAFSSGVRTYASDLRPSSEAPEANDWIEKLEALGGTNIYLALSEALQQSAAERTTIIIFLTDGLPTEGIVEEEMLLTALQKEAPNSARIFPFGVGYDVNTLLLDQIAENHKGRPAYVDPEERIDEAVSAFYARIQSPVLTEITLAFKDVEVYDILPTPLPDLYAGTQLIVTGRYVNNGPSLIQLIGNTAGQTQTYTYEGTFISNPTTTFIPRLWAARKIGDLLTKIRLHGENKEWVDAVVTLSQRYGIITPYTSFLIQEDMFTTEGRERAAEELMYQPMPGKSGEEAVEDAQRRWGLGGAAAPPQATEIEPNTVDKHADGSSRYIRYVGEKTFLCEAQSCTDTTYVPDKMVPQDIVFGTTAYWEALKATPQWGEYFALAKETIFVSAASPDHQHHQAYRFLLGEPEAWTTPRTQDIGNTGAITQSDMLSPSQITIEQSSATPTSVPTSTPQNSYSSTGFCNGAAALALISVVIVLHGKFHEGSQK